MANTIQTISRHVRITIDCDTSKAVMTAVPHVRPLDLIHNRLFLLLYMMMKKAAENAAVATMTRADDVTMLPGTAAE